MADPAPGAVSADDADASLERAVEDHLPDDDPHTHWFFTRFASAISSTYRSIDPLVAQLITAPGVLPTGPETDA
jgi:hypothetical protein